ncbi:hypothetical protein FACS1894199_17340 [Bacteroidia bacterium]|nr:hypothetical protein FACS1894199_17340 [Bacteroidia bacterium]
MKVKNIILILLVCGIGVCSCEKKKAPPIVPIPTPVEVVEKVVKEEKPVVVEEEPVVVNSNAKCFLIAGCFAYKSNADRLNAKLKKGGYKNSRILNYHSNLYLVTYEGYATRKQAFSALRVLVKDRSKRDAWVYTQK